MNHPPREYERRVTPDGNKLKNLRTERGWSAKDLAENSGYDRVVVNNAEKGGEVLLEAIQAFAKSLDVDYRDLLLEPKEVRLVEIPRAPGGLPKPVEGVARGITFIEALLRMLGS
jgi:transcriptional regulator with XRE-family HTH domain